MPLSLQQKFSSKVVVVEWHVVEKQGSLPCLSPKFPPPMTHFPSPATFIFLSQPTSLSTQSNFSLTLSSCTSSQSSGSYKGKLWLERICNMQTFLVPCSKLFLQAPTSLGAESEEEKNLGSEAKCMARELRYTR
jgi:hypothetical protein